MRLTAEPRILSKRCAHRGTNSRFAKGGGPEGKGWPWGLDLNIGMLFQRLTTVVGVEEVLDVLLFPADVKTYERLPDAHGVDRLELAPMDLFASVKHRIVILDEEKG